ncbi:hypothetical protein ACWGQ2_06525 [Arthrobacter sp. NPDC055585]
MSTEPAARSGRPGPLVLCAVVFTFVPVLPLVLTPILFVSSMAQGRGVSPESLFLLPFLAAVVAAVVTGVLAHRAVTGRRAWTMAVCTAGLLFVASAPVSFAFTKISVEGICEYAPGGVFGSTERPEDAPGICQWARS